MLHELAAQAGRPKHGDYALPLLSSNGSLAAALAEAARRSDDPGLPLIAEAKRASPSAGPLLTGSIADYLEAVRRGGACAISAVTAGGPFAGSLQLLREAHATGLPTLMKDFVADAAQLDAAVQHGASAVLLIERLQRGEERERLVRQAHDRGLEVLLEVHTSSEAAQAATSRADLLGVNSRDLTSLRVDVAPALDLVRQLAADRPTLLLSGVLGPMHAEQARDAKAAGILVGTALVTARAPATTARSLRRSVVKVCGNRTAQDVRFAQGADLIGVIVGTGSQRDVDLADAHAMLRQAELQGAAGVAVTRDRTQADLLRIAQALRPTFLQVHGSLEPGAVRDLQALGVGVLHAVPPGGSPTAGCDGTVTDSTAAGGSGRTHDGSVPPGLGLHLVAGGLDAANVGEAVQRSGAVGADASSRLETEGRKDAAKVSAFIAAARRAPRNLHGT